MIKGRFHIGAIGDYPLLLNDYESQTRDDYGSYMVVFTGYNSRGARNGIIVPNKSEIRGFEDNEREGDFRAVQLGGTWHGLESHERPHETLGEKTPVDVLLKIVPEFPDIYSDDRLMSPSLSWNQGHGSLFGREMAAA